MSNSASLSATAASTPKLRTAWFMARSSTTLSLALTSISLVIGRPDSCRRDHSEIIGAMVSTELQELAQHGVSMMHDKEAHRRPLSSLTVRNLRRRPLWLSRTLRAIEGALL